MPRSTTVAALRGRDVGRDGRPFGVYLLQVGRVCESQRLEYRFQELGLVTQHVSELHRHD